MKKLITIIAALAVSAIAANAQIWVSAGYNSVTHSTNTKVTDKYRDHGDGFFISGESEHRILGPMYFVHGLKFLADFGGTQTYDFSSFSVSAPVLLRTNVPLIGVIGTYAQVGPDFGLGLAYNRKGILTGSNDLYKDTLKRFRMGLDVGVGFTYKKDFRISFDYNFGLNNQSKIDGSKIKTSYFSVGIGRRF